jgi:hypothetical protein
MSPVPPWFTTEGGVPSWAVLTRRPLSRNDLSARPNETKAPSADVHGRAREDHNGQERLDWQNSNVRPARQEIGVPSPPLHADLVPVFTQGFYPCPLTQHESDFIAYLLRRFDRRSIAILCTKLSNRPTAPQKGADRISGRHRYPSGQLETDPLELGPRNARCSGEGMWRPNEPTPGAR